MRKSIFGLVTVLLALGLILAGCAGPFAPDGAAAKLITGEPGAPVFDPNDTYITYGNQGEGYKGDAITTIQVVTTGIEGWNWKTVYNFYLKNSAGDEFLSFCANYFSSGIGDVGLIGTLEPGQKEAIVGAFNYINNHFGSIDTWSGVYGELSSTQVEDNTKLVAQFAVWLVLDPGFDVQITQPGCEGIVAAAKAAVANPEDGDIGIYFLTGNDWPNDIEGTQPQIVPYIVPHMPAIPKGDIKIEKTVDGINIAAWVNENKAEYKFTSINDLISFNLYKVAGDGAPIVGAPFANVTLDAAGFISCKDLGDGWYAVEEVLTAKGKEVFKQAAPMYILIANGLQFGANAFFDYDAFYTIVNGYGSGYVLGYPGLNNTGDIFPIHVKNAATDEVYASFCANAGSKNFAGESGLDCGGYYVAEKIDRETSEFASFVKAYNYIENKKGKLDDNRAVTQAVTWVLLGAIDVNSPEFDAIEAWKLDKDFVKEVIANYMTYAEGGAIVDLVFMECEMHHDYEKCQPQLVPIYGDPVTFKNNSLPPPSPKGGINILKTVDGIAINAKFSAANLKNLIYFELYKNGEKVAGPVYVNDLGRIVFSDLEPGNYVIREIITKAGESYFYPHSDVSVTIGNSIFTGSADFDFAAPYSVDFNVNKSVTVFKDGDPQAIYEFIATNVDTGATYNSFCAFNNSHGFPPYYRVDENGLDPATYTKLLNAMNYIYTTYGSVDSFAGPFGWDNHNLADNTRVLTQAMVWIIANGVQEIGLDIGPWAFPDVAGFIAAFEDAIQAVLKNSPGATGPIARLVFLEGSMGEDYSIAQPQVIPLFGGNFENTSKKLSQSYGTVTATNAGNVPAILAGLNPKNGNAQYDKKAPEDPKKSTPFVVPNANHFVFAKMSRAELEAGVALEFLVGNKYELVGTGFVKLVDGNIVLTINNFANGEFGLIAFNKLPEPGNGNIHSQKEKDLQAWGAVTGFNHDNKAVVPCPKGDTIYLYFHAGSLQFYL